MALSFGVGQDFYGYLAAIIFSYCSLVQIAKIAYQRIWHEWL